MKWYELKREGYETYSSCDWTWCKYTRRTVRRTVYKKDGRFFIILEGSLVEVKRVSAGFVTLGDY